MANIKVNDIKSASADIKPAGTELFGDSESFISDLQDNELTVAGGCGGGPKPTPTPIDLCTERTFVGCPPTTDIP